MTRYLIDSDLAVYSMGGAPDSVLNRRLGACYPGDVAISAVSFAEVALGTWMGRPPRREVLDAFARIVPVLAFDEAAAGQYARLPVKRGRFDRLVAAHALSLGVTVITSKEADFVDVPGLKIENWTL